VAKPRQQLIRHRRRLDRRGLRRAAVRVHLSHSPISRYHREDCAEKVSIGRARTRIPMTPPGDLDRRRTGRTVYYMHIWSRRAEQVKRQPTAGSMIEREREYKGGDERQLATSHSICFVQYVLLPQVHTRTQERVQRPHRR
jgi:hypothetical protein